MAYDIFASFDLRSDKRLRATAPATITMLDGSTRSAAVVEISEHGCRLCGYDLPVGPREAISLMVDDVGPLDGYVVWRKGDFLGVHFANRLHQNTLRYVETYMRDKMRHPVPEGRSSDTGLKESDPTSR